MLIIRTSNTMLKLYSNCLGDRFYKTIRLEISFSDNDLINWYNNPIVYHLNVFGNKIKLVFNKARVVDRYDISKSIEYRGLFVYDNNALP